LKKLVLLSLISSIPAFVLAQGETPVVPVNPVPAAPVAGTPAIPAAQAIPVPAAQPIPVPAAQPIPVPAAQPIPVPAAQPIPVPAAQPIPVPAAQPVPATPTIPTPGIPATPAVPAVPAVPATPAAPTVDVPPIAVPTIKSPQVPKPGTSTPVKPIQIQVPNTTGSAGGVTATAVPGTGSGTTLTVPPPVAPKPDLTAPADVAAAPADAIRTSSGLASKVLTVGTGTQKPGPTDECTVHYSGWTLDGKLFDSSVQRGRPATFPLNGVIRGWTEGLQLMVPGEKRRLWIPSAMAYGDNPPPRPGGSAPPAGNLTFDVELISIKNASTGKIYDATPEPEPVVPTEPAEDDTALPECLAYVEALIEAGAVDKSSKIWRTRMPIYKPLTFAKGRKYFWDLDTNKGLVRVEFKPDVAPQHVSSFMYLTMMEYFDGLTFHRVIPGFMAQGGCPLGTGKGNPGYLIQGEFDGKFEPKMITENGKEIEAGREYTGTKHDKAGILSAANSGPKTEGSQFFLTFGPTSWLDSKHTVFGQVVAGLDILKLLEEQGSSSGAPKERLEITRATVVVE